MGVKIGNYGVIDETTAKNLLSGLKDTMDSVKDTLNDSFLSKDSVQNSVSAIVSAATGEEGTAATKKSAYELLFSQARGALNKEDGTDADPIINNLVLKLAQAAASDNNKEAIDDLTDSLVDDALDLAMDEIMKDEKYAKLLKTKLGAETMDEVREEIRRQLVEDTSFMDAVRKQVEKLPAMPLRASAPAGMTRKCWTVCRQTCCPSAIWSPARSPSWAMVPVPSWTRKWTTLSTSSCPASWEIGSAIR